MALQALRKLQDGGRIPGAPIHVAYNPYFPKDSDMKREEKRMYQKLMTGRLQRNLT